MKKRFYVAMMTSVVAIFLSFNPLAEAENRTPYSKVIESKVVYSGCMVEVERVKRRADKVWFEPILINLRSIESIDINDDSISTVTVWMKTDRLTVAIKDKSAFIHRIKECNK